MDEPNLVAGGVMDQVLRYVATCDLARPAFRSIDEGAVLTYDGDAREPCLQGEGGEFVGIKRLDGIEVCDESGGVCQKKRKGFVDHFSGPDSQAGLETYDISYEPGMISGIGREEGPCACGLEEKVEEDEGEEEAEDEKIPFPEGESRLRPAGMPFVSGHVSPRGRCLHGRIPRPASLRFRAIAERRPSLSARVHPSGLFRR